MSVIQPMYFAAGKYSAGTIRKHLSSMFQSASDGTRVEGVISSFDETYSLKVVPDSGRNLLVKTGLCVIADKATQSLASQDVDQPGLYIAGVVDTDHAVTIAANSSGSTRYDLVYAEMTETSFTVTNKTLGNSTGSASAANTAKLTTSSAHGFVVGQTVVVSGVDETFDGQYVITLVPSTTTFEYAKTASDVVSTAVTPYMQVGAKKLTITNKEFTQSTNTAKITTASHSLTQTGELITVQGLGDPFDGTFHISAFPSSTTIEYTVSRFPKPATVSSTAVSATSSTTAKASVPFAVKVLTGTTSTNPALPSSTNSIALARVTVANGASTISTGNISDRRVFTTSLSGVHMYDSTSSATQPSLGEGALRYATDTNLLQYNDGSTWQPVSILTLDGSGSATTAAKSDHTHSADTSYLGVSQILRNSTYSTTSGNRIIFPSASDSTVLDAGSSYLFEGTLIYYTQNLSPASIPNYFGMNASKNFQTINMDVKTHTVEESSYIFTGYSSWSSAENTVQISGTISYTGYGTFVTKIRGYLVVDATTDTTVNPVISFPAGSTLQIFIGTKLKFTKIGSDTASVITGNWS